MQVEMALRAKRGRIATIRMTETAVVAARLPRSENIGVPVVKDGCGTEGDAVLGVISERDIPQAIVDHGTAAFAMPVLAPMTRAIVLLRSDDTVDLALELMEEHHIRHLPVLHGGTLVGVISIRDVLSLAAPARPPAREATGALARA